MTADGHRGTAGPKSARSRLSVACDEVTVCGANRTFTQIFGRSGLVQSPLQNATGSRSGLVSPGGFAPGTRGTGIYRSRLPTPSGLATRRHSRASQPFRDGASRRRGKSWEFGERSKWRGVQGTRVSGQASGTAFLPGTFLRLGNDQFAVSGLGHPQDAPKDEAQGWTSHKVSRRQGETRIQITPWL